MDLKPRVFVKSYGCQMNVYDSGRMADSMAESGYEVTQDATDADLIILNTCHIREKATEKIYSEVGRLKAIRANRPQLKIAVAGCVAQAEGEEIIKRAPDVDIVVGPQSYHRLPSLVAGVKNGSRVVDTEFPLEDKFSRLPKIKRSNISSFLTVQEGCDKFCTFCVVPYTRGSEVSRPVSSIVDEANHLVECGSREITLLGQNVNAYHGVGTDNRLWTLAHLVHELSHIHDLQRIRFTTSHPKDMSDDLIEAFANCPKLMPYLHLPIQSGSNRILKAMNRRHTVDEYLNTIEKVRSAKPDIVISGDFIVGFPGETESDFQETIDVVQKVGYGKSFSFRFSPRPGTPAADMAMIDNAIAADRLARLQESLSEQQMHSQMKMVDKILNILFERPGRCQGQLVGKSEYLQAVHADAPHDLIGQIVPVHIIKAGTNSLAGQIIN